MMASFGTTGVNDDIGADGQSSKDEDCKLSPTSINKKKPTEEYEDYWLYAKNKTSINNFTPEENCGKWLIFEPFDKIDQVWSTIERETEMGELGFASKVSTMKEKVDTEKNFVICVYTHDHADETDVMRVRQRLKELGFTRKLPYKTDAATHAGLYRSTTRGRVSKYYC